MERITATEVKASQEEWEHKHGQGIVETMSGDFAELERIAIAMVDDLKARTPDPLTEVLDELVRDSEESTSGTTHTK